MITFPVRAELRSNERDQPKPAILKVTACVFDAGGFWVNVGGGRTIELRDDQLAIVQAIATTINHAYERGKVDARREMRDALGIPPNLWLERSK